MSHFSAMLNAGTAKPGLEVAQHRSRLLPQSRQGADQPHENGHRQRQRRDDEAADRKPNETQIHQVVMNLCTNGCHAMEKEGGRLEIDLVPLLITAKDAANYPDLNAGHYLKLMVIDTGHGIKPELLSRIFEPYFTTKEKTSGTGMGLAMVHGIVSRQGGFIKVESELGKGSRFLLVFPASRVRRAGARMTTETEAA